MYSLSLLGATALVLFGSRALIQVARAWVVNNKSAFHHTAFTVRKSPRREQQENGVGSH
jgi:hypothetical protein